MAKGTAPKRSSKPTAPSRNPVKLNSRADDKPARGRPRSTPEARRGVNFSLEESVIEKFNELAEKHRAKTNGAKHGAGKAFLVHMIESYKK